MRSIFHAPLSLLCAGMVAFCSGCKKKPADPSAPDAAGGETPRARVIEITEDTVAPPPTAPAEPVIDPAIPELKVNKSAQVAILCYHDFVTNKPVTQMRIAPDHFRRQMQSIKDARLPVISLTDFIKWRHGEKDIPDSSVMITMDDGYSSVYFDALPILKEFGYPFAIFLYKQYVNGGGRALTTDMIKEILASGGEIGSHSVSHPLNIAKPGNRTPEQYEEFLIKELSDSKQFLEDLFMRPVPTYAHPGGTYTQHILELGTQFGYEFMFSVNPAKATFESTPGLIPRYVILGNDPNDRNFKAALSFRGINDGDIGKQLLGDDGESLVSTYPPSNATIALRRPLISVNVGKLENIQPETIVMKLAGFGQVPCTYDVKTGIIAYQVIETLRANEQHVHVSFQRTGEDKPDMVSWKFFIDLVAQYLPEPPTTIEAPKAVKIMDDDSEPGTEAVAIPIKGPAEPAPKKNAPAKGHKKPH